MDTTPEPSAAVEEFVKRAERLASGAERHMPSWLRPGDPESRLPVLVALTVAIALQLLIPRSYTLVPRWPLVVLEVLLLVVLVALNPLRLTRSTLSASTRPGCCWARSPWTTRYPPSCWTSASSPAR